jgi:hypothetical protein
MCKFVLSLYEAPYSCVAVVTLFLFHFVDFTYLFTYFYGVRVLAPVPILKHLVYLSLYVRIIASSPENKTFMILF